MYGRCGSWWRGAIAAPFVGGAFPWGRGGRWGRFFGPGEIRLAILSMLETIAIILVLLWLLGLVSAYTMGGFIHILLVLAIITVLIRVIQGRNPVA